MHALEHALNERWPVAKWQDRTVLVAVSGGADSVALLRAMQRLKTSGAGKLVVGHYNHRQRGNASEADAQFVDRLATTLNLPLCSGQREADSAGSEEELRNERLQFLRQSAEGLGARYVVTAHTADDQVETIVQRIVRGTGIAGLAGIRRTRPLGEAAMLMRPLLGITRAEVLSYLRSLDQPFCEDASNRNTDFTRNRIRHDLLPLLARDYNQRVADAILRLGQLAGDAQAIVENAIGEFIEQVVVVKSASEVQISCDRFQETAEPMIREMFAHIWRGQRWPLADMGFAEWERLANLAMQPGSAAIELPGPVRAQKTGASLSLTRL